jgi:L-fucose isomerase-like protein
MQAEIFKRFYWWEDRCTQLMKERFGVSIVKKSFQQMGAEAKQIPDGEAEEVWKKWDLRIDLGPQALNSAIKIYLAVKKELDRDGSIGGVGINCLNESFYSDTTPCLAWALLFEERNILWACEADTMSLLSKYIIHKSLGVPIMMSNIYPFLMGMAALKHEHIEEFPQVEGNPDDYLLMVHCGYLGVVPPSFSTEWTLRPKVLDIVDPNASAIDARMPAGPVTISKLDPTLSRLQIIEGELEKYAQYPGSHCRNGAVIRVSDGHRLMESFYSHHNLLITGHRGVELKLMARALGLEVDEIR